MIDRRFSRAIAALIFLVPAVLCAEDFPELHNTEKTPDATRLAPETAARSFQLPEGFRAQVFAAEPDVQNPIGMAFDARGRLWIAENYTYAETPKRYDPSYRDRVIVLEDADGDGRFDRRTVFTDKVQRLTSVEVGHGGVWLMCPPQVLFIPDADGDLKPDGPPQVVLDGFDPGRSNSHNFANGLRFGPDGWLYGRVGHSCPGEIGVPGTETAERYPIRGSIWRYHPQTKRVEALTSGTVNPWGHDWTAEGEMFFVNTVIGHLWHMLPGAHYVRREPRDPYQHVYEMIDQHADHYHFDTGQDWTKSRDGAADSLGGGHAHSGAMIYLANNWPAEYRGRLFTLNLHGRRLNQEILEREGSGYVGRHGEDMAMSDDPWFRGLDLGYGPDGGVFVLDWSDAGECHENDGVHRTSGRIYKITYEGTERAAAAAPPVNLYEASDRELVDMQSHANEWFVRQSRLELARRAANNKLAEDTAGELRTRYKHYEDSLLQLRLLLTLHAIDEADTEFLKRQLQHKDEHVRAWAIRCLTDSWPIDGPLGPVKMAEQVQATVATASQQLQPLFITMAKSDDSPLVRLTLASTLQRLPNEQRAELAAALASHTSDAEDHNLPLMVWYGLIPIEPAELVDVFQASQWPKLRQFIARRLAEELSDDAAPLNALLSKSAENASAEARRDVLIGMQQAMRGWRDAQPPTAWAAFKQSIQGNGQDAALKLKCERISVVFGDPQALAALQNMAGDEQLAGGVRQQALQSIIDAKPTNLRQTCEQLLGDKTVGMVAAQGLATYPDAAVADRLIAAYPAWGPHERQGLLSLLVSRKAFAERLLAALAAEQVSRTDVTAYHIRQIHSLKDAELSQRVTDVWGTINDTPQAKQQAIARWKEKFNGTTPAEANLERGKELYTKHCVQCHRLYGEGGQIGPDLTGANRNNLHYLLENIIHPSAEVSADYRMTVLTLEDGRVLNGLVTNETDRTVTLQSPTEEFVVPRESIESNERTNLSPMPDGLLEPLTEQQVRDLIGYLMLMK